jgi:hypothetical protein
MEKIIDDVFNHRPTVIPEFTNLKELASSELGAYIERHVIDQWAINNISNNGVVNWLFGHEIENLDQLTRMRNQIKWMVDRGFHPKLMLHANGGYDTNPHVVRAMDVGDVVALDNYADGGYTQEDIENLKNELNESTNKEQTKMLKYELREAKFNLENAGKTRYCFDYLQLETFGMVFREFICVGDKDLIMQNETAVFMEYYNKLTKFCKDRPYLCKNKRI